MQFRDDERECIETNVLIRECSETESEMVMMRCISSGQRVVTSALWETRGTRPTVG